MFKEEDLEKLFRLSRVECSESEKASLLENLPRILGYISQLNEINTEEVLPCNHILESQVNIFRSDESEEPLSREEFLSNAPQHVGGMIKIPPVMKEE